MVEGPIEPISAEGGSVEKQMNRMYQEGGLQDDGARIEPVTGNEVPPGSMDQEVRDNIPAQLSEGEYVVPADVVRYYGVKFFEDLRGRAKEDFARMEAEGRVGGEPVDSSGVPMEQDEELTPEEMQMLAEALGQAPTGMAMGGVTQQQQAMYDPYQQQQMQYTQPMFQSTRTGMQEGGDVTEFNPDDWRLTESGYGGMDSFGDTGGMELVEYINTDTGQTRMITVLNGKPIGLVPEGFVRSTEETRQQAQQKDTEVETKTQLTRMGGDGPPEGYGEMPSGPSVDMDMKSGVGAIKGNIRGNKIGKGVAGFLGAVTGLGTLGKAFGVDSMMDKKTARQNMVDAVTAQKRNLDDAEEAMSMAMDYARDIGLDDDQISDMMSEARGTVSDTFSGEVEGSMGQDPMGDVGFSGDTRSGKALGRASEAPGPGPSRGRSEGRGPSGPAGAAGTGPGPSQGGAGGPSSGGSSGRSGPAGAAGTGAGPSQGGAGGPSSGGTSGGRGGPAGASGTAGAGGPSGSDDAGTPRYEGGLMGDPKGNTKSKTRKPNQRKKPYKNKRSGLGSK